MYNKIILIGNLTRDPEVRYTPNGAAVTTVSIACNTRIKKGDEWQDEVLFMDSVFFGKYAESVAKRAKGERVLVEGRLRLNTWNDKETGVKKSRYEVVGEVYRSLTTVKTNTNGEVPEVMDAEPF